MQMDIINQMHVFLKHIMCNFSVIINMSARTENYSAELKQKFSSKIKCTGYIYSLILITDVVKRLKFTLFSQ